jgi:D-lactate dehydrogenase (cytochrome)
MMDTHQPDVVVVPATTEQVVGVVRLAKQAGVPVIPRGAGTGLSGGATPIRGGIVVSFARMEEVLDVDTLNKRAYVQPGVVNFELSEYLKSWKYHFAPDPSSQKTCTLGGNIANNSGGPHCLKYGVTANHILALELVLHDGQVIWTSDGLPDAAGYDLTGLVVGSEGTFGLVTQALVRITRLPEANRVVLGLFDSIARATEVVTAVIAAGYLPTSLEMMDNYIIRAVNKGYNLGLPEDAGAALIIEVDGVEDGLDDLLNEIMGICREHGAIEIRPAKSAAEQTRVWAARKNAFGAIGRLAPAYYLADTVVPRTRLPFLMDEVARLSREYNLEIANVFHAGDGNLHPIVLYNPRDADETQRALTITSQVIKTSIDEGGVLSGEHGIGIEKQKYMPLFFSEPTMQAMAAVYSAFNPDNSLNPFKIFPRDMEPLKIAEQRQARIAMHQASRSLDDLGGVLEGIVGAEYMVEGEAASSYAIDGNTPRCVVLPATIEQVSEVMAACHQAGALVAAWGGGTQQASGYLVEPPDVVVVTRRLNQVVKYEPDDLTIGIEAGMTLAELHDILMEHNQHLPLDAPLPEQATLGGLVATAADGPHRLGYGILRDSLLGLTVVEVDGTVIQVGGQVVKNVSGYDLVKLFLGSYGTLGVIGIVNLKTFPAPRAESTFVATFGSRNHALAMLSELAKSPLTPMALEYLNRGALQRLGMVGECALAVRAEGLAVACARHMRDLQNMAVRYRMLESRELQGDDHHDLWGQVANLSAAMTNETNEMLIRLVVQPLACGAALTHIEEYAAAHGLACVCNARALNGVIYARLGGDGDVLMKLQHDLMKSWKHSHVLACNPDWKAGMSVWGEPPACLDVMQSIKRAFDPFNRLNPGRYVV